MIGCDFSVKALPCPYLILYIVKDFTNTPWCAFDVVSKFCLVEILVVVYSIQFPIFNSLQFPITLAWACTVHKVQQMTLNEIVVSFDLNRQNHLNYGQIYVALSRATSLQGLHVIGKIENKHVRANPKVQAEYHRMRQQENAYSDFNSSTSDAHLQNLKVRLLNMRCLAKHSIDIKHDASLTKCDILALMETQLSPHLSDDAIRQALHPYKLHRQDHPSDKFSSLAICTKDNINILQTHYVSVINGLMFYVFNSNTNRMIRFLLTYRKNNSNITQYVENLNNILQRNTIDIILGDFNINYFNQVPILPLQQLMNSSGYTQIVDKPTFLSAGSLLDQVYVKQYIHAKTQNEVISVYYSDHDCGKIVIKL